MAAMWTFALARLAGILLLGLVVGLFFQPIWPWLLAAACLYLAWQLLNLHRLDRWLRLRSQLDPPNIGGVWGDVVGQVVRLHRRKQFHKHRLVQPPGRALAGTQAPGRYRPAHRQSDSRA